MNKLELISAKINYAITSVLGEDPTAPSTDPVKKVLTTYLTPIFSIVGYVGAAACFLALAFYIIRYFFADLNENEKGATVKKIIGLLIGLFILAALGTVCLFFIDSWF